MIFCQNFAGAIFVVVAEVIFRRQLTKDIRNHVSGVSASDAINAGASASAVRHLVPAGSTALNELLKAYADSINKVFLLLVGLCGVGFIAAFGMGWKDTRKAAKKADEGDKNDANTE